MTRERKDKTVPFHLFWLAQRNITLGDKHTHLYYYTCEDLPCTAHFQEDLFLSTCIVFVFDFSS